MLKAQLDKDFVAIKAGEISVCNYDGVSREYLSTITEILAKGVGLPANSCIDAPLEKKEGMVVCRTKDLSAWEYINDHRGETVYDIETAKPFIITELGDYPTNTTSIVPASDFCKWDGEKWVEDILLKREADKISAEKYREEILNGIDKIISDWKIELLLGDISDSDKERLSAWMMYKASVRAVDVSTAPEVLWPQKPE
ncbi:MAG: tail fiber assembly protein [Pantoea ananatis]|uniref:tail fiber assembly protein n=1 Tax=Pantoea TaxID=53335 RepID=UPI000E270CC5|nr:MULTISPECIES: tail fiber assembly protein [Pantoea]MCH9272281.1 tail fiber assembly protein [Pantoea ananatis]MCS4495684.1 tail fiber assembly protein [Pantoea sp. B623]NEK83064.1 tail fiber assembly protein [Pantoea ananatis]REF06744.1 virus tail fiber assembly protein lambda gpK [Pantoea ananatis]TDL47656.1 tail fiber assembly protein [Pantoea ananatis]